MALTIPDQPLPCVGSFGSLRPFRRKDVRIRPPKTQDCHGGFQWIINASGFPKPVMLLDDHTVGGTWFAQLCHLLIPSTYSRKATMNPAQETITQIDEQRLESDLAYRFEYLAGFIGFGESDIDAIHAAAPSLAPIVPALVDAVYVKLFSYDATKRHFVPAQDGYEGELPADLESLTLEHDVIKFRKQHLTNYLVALVTRPYDHSMVKYLNGVGKSHTAGAGKKTLVVPLIQMNALMGFVSDSILATIRSLDMDAEVTTITMRAFNRLLWIQNDLINRHYCDGIASGR